MRVNGNVLSTGSAFTVATKGKSFLITNRHNLTGRRQDDDKPLSTTGGLPDEVVIWHNQKDKLFNWVRREEKLFDDGEPRWIEHPTLGSSADLVLLPLTNLNDVQVFPYNLAVNEIKFNVGAGDPVSVIGFPFGRTAGGFFGIWATGFLASESDVKYDSKPMQLIDCRTRQGQSGSPVIAYRGQGTPILDRHGQLIQGPVWHLIGIYSGRINNDSDIGMIWTTHAIQELVDSIV